MKKTFLKIFKSKTLWIIFGTILVLFLIFVYWPTKKQDVIYGVTFSSKYARELKVNPKSVLRATFEDLNFRKIRLIAYWDEIEKDRGIFDFSDLDWQIEMAKEFDAEVIFAVGRRVPRWPECHIPIWATDLTLEEQDEIFMEYFKKVINRYKDEDVIKMWQIENEPFLSSYAKQYCGHLNTEEFLPTQIHLVKELDPDRKILITDSGELSTWRRAFKQADVFGSTLYIFIANEFVDDFRMYVPKNAYNFKLWLWNKIYGPKESILIEVSIEPWLTKPIIKTPISEQISKMGTDRMNIILNYSKGVNFKDQYLWGVEWWYYLKEKGHPEIWETVEALPKI